MDDAEAIGTVRELLDEATKVSRELGQLAEDMVAQSEAGRAEAKRLIAALAEATAVLGDAEPEESPAVINAPTPVVVSDGARMLARQMLANGSDRTAVEQSLRTSFHVEDAAAVVDSLL